MWLKNFSYPYAFTGHSLQGDTIDKSIVIFDTEFEHVSRKWLYVALTRSSDLNNVYVYLGKVVTKLSVTDIENKIVGYIRQDISAHRGYNESKFVNIEWVIKQSKLQMHRCSCCNEVMNLSNDGGMLDWTIDRTNNDLGHEQDNCTLLCGLHCNISKKEILLIFNWDAKLLRPKERFKFCLHILSVAKRRT